jgi:hypothetical protein
VLLESTVAMGRMEATEKTGCLEKTAPEARMVPQVPQVPQARRALPDPRLQTRRLTQRYRDSARSLTSHVEHNPLRQNLLLTNLLLTSLLLQNRPLWNLFNEVYTEYLLRKESLMNIIVHLLLVLLVVAVVAWLLSTYVSGTLAALSVIIGVVYAVYVLVTGKSKVAG